jgi:hypothetical protein
LVANTIRSTRKLVNGTPGLMDSLFWEGGPPLEVAAAVARGGYSLIDVDVPPHAVNVRVSGGLWHGVPLDDLSNLVESVATDATVISLLVHKEHLEIDMYSIKSAQHGLPGKMEVYARIHFGICTDRLQASRAHAAAASHQPWGTPSGSVHHHELLLRHGLARA